MNPDQSNTYASFKKILDLLAYCDDESIRDVIETGKVSISRYSGVGNNLVREINTSYYSSKSEKVIKGPTNSFIVLGKDRFSGHYSGYGGIGATGAAAIDIFVGHMGTRPIEEFAGRKLKFGKDFKNDSARLYISQMCDIDEYFDIPKFQTKVGNRIIDLEACKATSGIALKADNVRLISRESIKLVTFHSTINSLGNESAKCGIDIIAGINIAKLGKDPTLDVQPMVKGGNLIECLSDIINKIDEVSMLLGDFMEKQTEINSALASHTHLTGTPTKQTSPKIESAVDFLNVALSIEKIAQTINNIVGSKTTKATYFSALSPKYINSTFNRVN